MSGTRAPKTIVVYDITGQTDYTIPFEYLARKFVVVTLIGQDRKVLTLNTDYRFTTKTTIGLSDPSPVGYDKIEIRRFTSATDRLVDFHDGSILRAYDLNLSQIQTLHVAEEARDLAGDSLAVNDNGDLDARGRKIVNLGDAENDKDAVNLGQLKEFDNSTFNNAQAAKASADAAKVSENKAKSSENRAVTAETRAVASAGTAVQAAMDANASKEAAEDAEQIVVPLVPIVEKASQDAAQAAADAAQAVQDVKDLGAVPIGSIFPFVKTPPAGYLPCDGSTFSKDEYPDLYKYLDSTTLPDMRGRYLKMSDDLANLYKKFPALIPALLHDVDISHTHTASQVAHTHNRGTMEITGRLGARDNNNTLNRMLGDPDGAFHINQSATASVRSGQYGISESWGGGLAYFNASRSWTGETSSVAPAITVNALTNVIRQTTNMRLQNSNPDIKIGNALEVKHMTVVYAIKAAGKVADEGLMEVTQIKKDLTELSNKTWEKSLDAYATLTAAGFEPVNNAHDLNNLQQAGNYTGAGSFINTPLGDGIQTLTGQINVYRRNYDAGVAVIQKLYHGEREFIRYAARNYSPHRWSAWAESRTTANSLLEWRVVEPETGSTSSVRWVRAGVWGDNLGETKWRYVDDKTIEVVGIIRVKSFQAANTYNILKLPTGKTLKSLGNFFQPVHGNHVNLVPSYAQGAPNSDTISVVSTADTDLGTLFFINWTIPLN